MKKLIHLEAELEELPKVEVARLRNKREEHSTRDFKMMIRKFDQVIQDAEDLGYELWYKKKGE